MTQQELNYNAGAQYRAEVFKEINANPVRIDRTVFEKSPKEKADLATVQNQFKHNGLKEWNERNRAGNNKKSA